MSKGFCISVILRVLRQVRIENGDEDEISSLEEIITDVGCKQRENFERYKLSSSWTLLNANLNSQLSKLRRGKIWIESQPFLTVDPFEAFQTRKKLKQISWFQYPASFDILLTFKAFEPFSDFKLVLSNVGLTFSSSEYHQTLYLYDSINDNYSCKKAFNLEKTTKMVLITPRDKKSWPRLTKNYEQNLVKNFDLLD